MASSAVSSNLLFSTSSPSRRLNRKQKQALKQKLASTQRKSKVDPQVHNAAVLPCATRVEVEQPQLQQAECTTSQVQTAPESPLAQQHPAVEALAPEGWVLVQHQQDLDPDYVLVAEEELTR